MVHKARLTDLECAEEQLAKKDAEIERLKTVPMKYRRMAFNAQLQDENEQLRQKLAKKDAEIERIKLDHEACCVIVADMHAAAVGEIRGPIIGVIEDVADVRQQLVACQAREQQLREALRKIADLRNLGKIEPEVVAFEALALPQDTTALQAMIAKAGEVMRERCREDVALCYDTYGVVADLRYLPGVTLEDLKSDPA